MNEKHQMKRIPYGVADFDEFRKSNLYYVDKTRYIREIEERGKYLFFIRPRRFGKSLFLGILEAYYDIDRKDRFDYFFNGTEIHQNPTAEKNSYLVFKLNFSLVNPNISLVEGSFLNYIQESASDFVMKYGKLLAIDIIKAQTEFSLKKSSSDVMVTLLKYCLRKGQKLYVIIDEYDNFANTILAEAGEEEYQKITHGGGFLRSFFNVLKGGTTDTDAPISRLFMSGVSPITLDDVTSGFNIGVNISLEPGLNEMLGFTREEIIRMIEYYRENGKIKHSTAEILEIMNSWYNHYRFSMDADTEVFNTVHVLYFFDQYFVRSKIPYDLVDSNVRIDYRKLRRLIIIDRKDDKGLPGTPIANGNFSKLRQIIEKGYVHSDIVKSFPVEKLVSPENFVSLLYYFGLLTIAGMDEEHKAILKIPNESIKRLYYDYIKESYEESGILTLDVTKYEDLMKDMAFKGKWKPLLHYLVEQMEASMGIRDLITGERAIQAFLNVYLGLSALYLVYSEKELKKGYADLVLEPFLAQYPQLKYSYLLEIKYTRSRGKQDDLTPEKIKAIKDEAESQLNRYCRDEKFKKAVGHTILKKLVLIFHGTRLVYHGEV